MKTSSLYTLAALLVLTRAASAQEAPPSDATAEPDAATSSPGTSQPTPATDTISSPSQNSATTPSEEEPEKIVVVTPTRNPRPLTQSTSAVTVITRQQIEQKKPFDVTDIINQVPGISVSQSGTRGKQTRVFLRGAAPDQTLVLIDGVRVNARSFGGFDFGTLAVENIERIEVLRGPQSALYGSDAMGGVINIITRRGTGEFSTGGRIEFGSYSTNKQVVTAGGELGKNRLSFAATRLNTNGFHRNDDYRNLGASLRFDHPLSEQANLAFTARIDDARIGTPGQVNPSFFAFDPNARSDQRNIVGSIEYSNKVGKRRDLVTLGLYDRHLDFNDPANPGDPNAFANQNRFRDRVLTLDGQTSFALGKHTLTVGAEYYRESASVDILSTSSEFPPFAASFSPTTSTQALYVQDEFRSGKLALVPGVRFENNSQYGSDINGRVSASYDLSTRSRIKTSVGTAFQSPTFDQLFFPPTGVSSNPNLRPEESVGYDIGYELQLAGGGRFEATLFRNRYRDLINSGFPPVNINRATTQGLELYLNQPFGNGFRAIINHSFLRTESSSAPLVRRPKFATSADLLYRRGKAQFDLGFVAQGRRFDIGPSFTPEPFEGYTRFDLTAGYDIRPGVQAYVRAQNLFNRKYEEVAGFRAPRFNLVVGLATSAF
jgi:vitamin B12 transporter